MKIILTSKVKNLGNIGDVKVVADGYAKNCLLAKKVAVVYSDELFQNFEARRIEIQKQSDKDFAIAITNKEKIEKIELVVLENAGDNDKLYGSITSIRLANVINDLVKEKVCEKTNIIIKTPIKELGKFNIIVELHHDVIFDKEIIIARSNEEAMKIKNNEKK